MSDNFYRAFEDRYRGSREVIKARLNVYHPFLKMMGGVYPGSSAIDLGCGRGEWLEILKESGFKGVGIDLDSDMLSSCIDLGLDVKNIDALSALSSIADESQSVVSAFHLVEHLNFDDVKALIGESLRVLKPGGLLILETPNPENIVVGANSFYLDPSHERPIPPLLLSFAAEFYGFNRVKIMRLQDSSESLEDGSISLFEVLYRVSPDYAVMAQKGADESLLKLFLPLFNKEYGQSLIDLTARFDAQNSADKSGNDKIFNTNSGLELSLSVLAKENATTEWLKNEWAASEVNARALSREILEVSVEKARLEADLQAKASELELSKVTLLAEREIKARLEADLQGEKARTEWLKNEWEEVRSKLLNLQFKSQELEELAFKHYIELQEVTNSRSWRLTKPLRIIKRYLQAIPHFPVFLYEEIKSFVRNILIWIFRKIDFYKSKNSKLILVSHKFAVKFPSISRWKKKLLKVSQFEKSEAMISLQDDSDSAEKLKLSELGLNRKATEVFIFLCDQIKLKKP